MRGKRFFILLNSGSTFKALFGVHFNPFFGNFMDVIGEEDITDKFFVRRTIIIFIHNKKYPPSWINRVINLSYFDLGVKG